jgi:multidrug resistance efflux pump
LDVDPTRIPQLSSAANRKTEGMWKLVYIFILATNQRAAITADKQGRVAEVFVENGQYVEKGTPVLKLDVSLSTADAEARLLEARADQQLASIACERSKRLYAERAISRSELDRQGAACASTSEAAKIGKDGIVRAPFDGIVGERGVDVGDWIAPGRSLFTLE